MSKDISFVLHMHYSDYKRMPWKNGGGETAEIAIFPPTASLERLDFHWRLSTAKIQESGEFSTFAGYQRLLCLAAGKALKLNFTEKKSSELLQNDKILAFSGEHKITAELVSGPVQDLGLLFREEKVKPKLNILKFKQKARSFSLTAKTVFFYVISGSFKASVYPGELVFDLELGDTLRVNEAPQERLVMCEPLSDGSIAVIEINSTCD